MSLSVKITVLCENAVGARVGSGEHGFAAFVETREVDYLLIKKLSLAFLTLIPYAVVLGIYMAILPGYMKELQITSSEIGFLLTLTNGVRGIGFFNSEQFVRMSIKKSMGLASLLMFMTLGI